MRPAALLGVRIAANGQRSAWQQLPTDNMGSLLDEDDLRVRIAGLLRLLGSVAALPGSRFGVGVGIAPTTMMSIGPISLSMGNEAAPGCPRYTARSYAWTPTRR